MIRSLAAIGLLLFVAPNAWGAGEEHVGNDPLSAANYADWPNAMPVINDAHRVYYSWVNGNEHFYFQGDTAALNAALKKFAAIKAERRVVVLRPAPARTTNFSGDQSFEFNWNLHLLGGIAKHMSTRDQGSNVWDPHPYLHVYVGGAIELAAIKLPKGVEVLEIADLQKRYAKSFASTDQNVRGWSCGELARLDPYDLDSMKKIAAQLDDKADWVKLNAAGALALFTTAAPEALKELQAVKTADGRLNERLSASIKSLSAASPDEAARRDFQKKLGSIHAFVVDQRKE